MPLRLTLDIHTMTFGELMDFADAARASGADRTAPVPVASFDVDGDTVDHLVLDVPAGGTAAGALSTGPFSAGAFGASPFGAPTAEISAEEAAGFVDALETTLSEGGDARGVLAELTRLRDQLRGI